MKITALEEYGLRCMLLLAQSGEAQSLTLPEISEQEGVSLPYAGKLLMILRKAGLVHSERGRNGGYSLAESPVNITVKKVFDAVGNPLYDQSHCDRYNGEEHECVHASDCKVKWIWKDMNRMILDYLDGLTLQDLLDKQGMKTSRSSAIVKKNSA